MTQKSKIRSILVIGILLAVYCVLVFVIPFKREAVFWISFAFAAAAFAAQLYYIKTSLDRGEGAKSKVYGFPILKVGILYLILTVIVSFIFIILATFVDVPVWIPVIVFVLLLAAAAIGLIATESVRDEVERQETVVKKNVETMKRLRAKATLIAETCEEPETRKLLQGLAESFRFSDPVSNEATEEAEAGLNDLLGQLKDAVDEKKPEEIEALVKKTAKALSERNLLCKSGK